MFVVCDGCDVCVVEYCGSWCVGWYCEIEVLVDDGCSFWVECVLCVGGYIVCIGIVGVECGEGGCEWFG